MIDSLRPQLKEYGIDALKDFVLTPVYSIEILSMFKNI